MKTKDEMFITGRAGNARVARSTRSKSGTVANGGEAVPAKRLISTADENRKRKIISMKMEDSV